MPSLLTPKATGPAVAKRKGRSLEFWKQVIPQREVWYTDPATKQRVKLDFDDPQYHQDVKAAFHNRLGPDSVAFQLADSQNRHGRDWDPERVRGVVADMRTFEELPPKVRAQIEASAAEGRTVEPRGTYAKIRMFNEQAAQAVLNNKDLAVSARVREGFERADGVKVPRAVVHVCGTYDSQVPGMSPWTEADLTGYPGEDGVTLDLSNTSYQEAPAVGKQKSKSGTGTRDPESLDLSDLEGMSDEELHQLAQELGMGDEVEQILSGSDPEDDDDDEEGDEDDDESDEDGTQLAGGRTATLVSAGTSADLSTVHQVALAAGQRADEALRQLAEGQWVAERDRLMDAGVPVAAIDLCAPYLSEPGGFTVDLSNSDGTADSRDVAGDMRRLLGLMSGYVDLTTEQGHGGGFNPNSDADPDAQALKDWDRQFPG